MCNINGNYNIYQNILNTNKKKQEARSSNVGDINANNRESLSFMDINRNAYSSYLVSFSGMTMQLDRVENVQECDVEESSYKNDLKTLFQNNDAKIMAIVIRNFNARDEDGNELIQNGERKGTFINAIARLDELKELGINTLHVLPISPPGKKNAMGTAGSVYSPRNIASIDPALDDLNDPRSVEEECRDFIKACHSRGIRVMIDLPSCASYELFLEKPELMAFDRNGVAKTPQGWNDIRMFQPYADQEKRTLNSELLELHKDFVDMAIDMGFDGIRADVARAKPTEFWDYLINYSHEKDPQFAWLAETYTYEDASPQLNMPADRPEDQLMAGFDAIYGQYHIFHEWTKASELNNYVIDNLKMANSVGLYKSIIGSFGTHDDESLMFRGGTTFCNLVIGLQATLPMLNPYFLDGFQSGDEYLYSYRDSKIGQTDTDSNILIVHKRKFDIFNNARKPQGTHPEIGEFMAEAMKMRENYKDVITKGSYIPLTVDDNGSDSIIAFARHYKGKTLLVVANRDLNNTQNATITIPTLRVKQELKNILPSYGEKSIFQIKCSNELTVDLGKGRIHVFEINTPNIEKACKNNVYRQNK